MDIQYTQNIDRDEQATLNEKNGNRLNRTSFLFVTRKFFFKRHHHKGKTFIDDNISEPLESLLGLTMQLKRLIYPVCGNTYIRQRVDFFLFEMQSKLSELTSPAEETKMLSYFKVPKGDDVVLHQMFTKMEIDN